MARILRSSVCGMALMMLCLSQRGRADEILLYDGKKISGQIQKIDADALTVEVGKATRKVNLFDITSYKFVQPALPGNVSQLLIDGEKPSYAKGPRTAKVKLRKGYQRFTLPYYHTLGVAKLEIKMSGPGLKNAEVPREMLSRVTDEVRKIATSEYRVDKAGFRLPLDVKQPERYVAYRLLEWKDPDAVKSILDLRYLPVKRYGASPRLALLTKRSAIHFGIIYEGLIKIPQDGEYTFSIETDKNSKAQLYIGDFPRELYRKSKGKKASGWQIAFAEQGKLTGEIKQWDASGISVNLPVASQDVEVTLIPEAVHEIWKMSEGFSQPASPERKNESKTEDTAYIRTSDGKVVRVAGEVSGMNDQSLRFLYQGQEREVKRERVVGLVLHKKRSEKKNHLKLMSLIRLIGGSQVPGVVSSGKASQVTIKLPWGEQVSISKEDLESVKTINARSVSLTEMIPESVTQVPFFNRILPYQVNRSFSGKELQIGKQVFKKGLCVHAKTVLVYQLDQQFEKFNVTPGLQNGTGELGNVAVSIVADGKTLFENQEFTSQTQQEPLNVDVSGCSTLTLTVDFGKNQNVGDRFVWGAPQLIRASPQGLAVSKK
ncbi:NPCBM/NEW2 domain protein [Gimesia panareensis]|uniref:NPCBM/NEW2 domain protein n=1 Tax=Gimesia panareensis TaxID=2527978 RepID=A0A518FIW2_9PLAN|nr:NPCBM/NEW2 domain-containing protein [Gimesia panareensis]QDV16288.1 NPCBM/NEW2 domain protein [Gimesia panareensis]